MPFKVGKKFPISQRQIKMGINHEMEHVGKDTKNPRTFARKIAMDHLWEDPQYYTHLNRMEKQVKSKRK
jgi:hypothetical protein